MKKVLCHGLIVATAVFATLPATSPRVQSVMHPKQQTDPRLIQLQRFFAENSSPVGELSEDFLKEADAYDLDWRLLPSLSIIESGGGKEFKNNNIFGWDSGNTAFPTIEAGIHHVAKRLSTSKLYKDKDLDTILRTYNPDGDYAERVKSVMARLGLVSGSLESN
jgi:hypothetical protein